MTNNTNAKAQAKKTLTKANRKSALQKVAEVVTGARTVVLSGVEITTRKCGSIPKALLADGLEHGYYVFSIGKKSANKSGKGGSHRSLNGMGTLLKAGANDGVFGYFPLTAVADADGEIIEQDTSEYVSKVKLSQEYHPWLEKLWEQLDDRDELQFGAQLVLHLAATKRPGVEFETLSWTDKNGAAHPYESLEMMGYVDEWALLTPGTIPIAWGDFVAAERKPRQKTVFNRSEAAKAKVANVQVTPEAPKPVATTAYEATQKPAIQRDDEVAHEDKVID